MRDKSELVASLIIYGSIRVKCLIQSFRGRSHPIISPLSAQNPLFYLLPGQLLHKAAMFSTSFPLLKKKEIKKKERRFQPTIYMYIFGTM